MLQFAAKSRNLKKLNFFLQFRLGRKIWKRFFFPLIFIEEELFSSSGTCASATSFSLPSNADRRSNREPRRLEDGESCKDKVMVALSSAAGSGLASKSLKDVFIMPSE